MKKRVAIVAVGISCVALFVSSIICAIKSNANELQLNNNDSSSKELIEEVLNYEKISDVYLYNNPEDSVEVIEKGCKALEELKQQEDYVEAVVDAYETIKLSEDFTTKDEVFYSLETVNEENLDETLTELLSNEEVKDSVEEDVTELACVYFLECLITSRDFVEQSSESEIEAIKKATYNKYLEKEESNLYTGLEEDVYKVADLSDTAKDLGVDVTSKAGYAYITTPRGTKVEVMINDYAGDRWANSVTMQMKKEYPNAKILAKADNRYNCHSYAWYLSNTSNGYWLNDPIAFVTDGSFVETSRFSKNDKVVWVERRGLRITYVEHSGVVTGVSGKNTIIVSKWGQGPLVQHTDTYSPYECSVTYFTKNR